MAVEIRTLAPGEVDAWMRSEEVRWGDTYAADRLDLWRALVEPERCLAAVDGGRMVGSAGSMASTLGLPGGRVPAAAVTWVSVHPTHRRRGILREMMERQLAAVAAAGREPVAILGASESVIYRRFGYGMASTAARLEIDTARAGFARPHVPAGRVEIVDLETFLAAAPEVFRRLCEEGDGIPGSVGRSPAYWRMHATDAPFLREGMSPRLYALHHGPAGIDGYLMYRLGPKWTDLLADYTLRVEEMLAAPGDAESTLWRYCLDHDLVRHVSTWRRPVEEPLLHLLADPRQLRRLPFDDLWVRVLDVRRALEGRRYSVEDAVVLEVVDPMRPEVAGRWRLEGGPEGARCDATHDGPDLRLDAAALGSLLCGGVSCELLARSGLADEETPGAAVRAARMFTWHRAPWNLSEF